ncbi:hypothetical protein AAMO2058_001081800 [Amorphochlora amoebiformis]
MYEFTYSDVTINHKFISRYYPSVPAFKFRRDPSGPEVGYSVSDSKNSTANRPEARPKVPSVEKPGKNTKGSQGEPLGGEVAASPPKADPPISREKADPPISREKKMSGSLSPGRSSFKVGSKSAPGSSSGSTPNPIIGSQSGSAKRLQRMSVDQLRKSGKLRNSNKSLHSPTSKNSPRPKVDYHQRKISRSAFVQQSFGAMPQQEDLEMQFVQLMEEKLVPEAKIKILSASLSLEQKWAMVSESKKLQKKTPVEWVAVLFSPNLTLKQLMDLKIEIQGAGKGFLEEWVANQGLRALLQKIDNTRIDVDIRYSLVEVLTAFANNSFGLKCMIQFPQAVSSVSGVLLNGDTRMKKKILQLLIALCYESDEGLEAVMDALGQKKFKRRFRILVHMIQEEKDLNLRTDVATLINTLVCSPPEIEKRIEIRYELLDLKYPVALEKAEEYFAKIKGDGSNEYGYFRTQVDVFEEEMKSDTLETLYNKVDLSDIDEVMLYMKSFTAETGHSHDLLSMMHPMMKIPTTPDGDNTWKSILHVVHKACDYFSDIKLEEITDIDEVKLKEAKEGEEDDEEIVEIERLPMTYKELIQELKEFKLTTREEEKRIQEEAKNALETLRKENHRLKLRESQLKDDAKALRKQTTDFRSKVTILEDQAQKNKAIIDGFAELKKEVEKQRKLIKEQKIQIEDAKKIPVQPVSTVSTEEVKKLKAEIKALKEELENVKASAATTGIPPPPGAGGIPPPPGAGGIPPPPGAGGIPPPPGAGIPPPPGAGIPPPPGAGGIPPPPGFGIPPPPGGIPLPPGAGIPPPPGAGIPPPPGGIPPPPGGGIPPPPGLGGLPPPPSMGGLPPPPSMGGMPPPPMMGGFPAAPAQPQYNLPYQKKKLVVKKKLKVLHWKPLKLEKIESTCWNKFSDQKVQFDTTMLEKAFAVVKKKGRTASKKGAGVKSGASPAKKKKEVVNLIDSKRSYNINIALARFRMSHEAIRDALFRMDSDVLNEDKLVTLAKCKPETEEIDMVTSFEGEISTLGQVEQFFRTIAEVGNIQFRIDSFLFKTRFQSNIDELQQTVDTIKAADRALRNSKSFQLVLEYILAFGNYLNHSNKKGGAYGIALSSLDKLKGMKTSDGKSNLLEFLVITIRERAPEAISFIDEFQILAEAQRVDLTFLESSVSKNVGMVRRIGNEVKKLESKIDQNKDLYVTVMKEYYDAAFVRVNNLSDDMKKAVKSLVELVEYYGENPKKCSTSDFLSYFIDFAAVFKKTGQILDKKKELEKRQQQREAQKASKKSNSGKKKLPGMGPGGLLQVKKKKDKNKIKAAMNTLRSDDASKIRSALRTKRKKIGTIKFRKSSIPSKKASIMEFEQQLMRKIKAASPKQE